MATDGIQHVSAGHEWEQGKDYSAAVRVPAGRDLVYVAGQVAYASDGSVVGVGDVEAQADQAYRNLVTALEAAGSDPSLLVKLTVYVLDREYRNAAKTARRKWIPSPLPASTLIVVPGLALPELLIEVEAVAVARD